MRPRARAVAFATTLLALVATACTEPVTTSPPIPERSPSASSTVAPVEAPLVVAVGDLVCEPGAQPTPTTCQHAATAALTRRLDPQLVLLLGDLQYEDGDLGAYEDSFDATWGPLRAITRPVPGNHDYHAPGAAGYYRYFEGIQGGPSGYYAFDVGSWRIYALNSNCDEVDCAEQRRWLDADMAAQPRECTALTMHHPRYSSARHGPSGAVEPLWDTALDHHADIALAGHDHTYERFVPMNATGSPTPGGITSFVVGTGGKSLYDFGAPAPGSAVRHNAAFGVLSLRLDTKGYAWEFRTVSGEVVDEGTARCV